MPYRMMILGVLTLGLAACGGGSDPSGGGGSGNSGEVFNLNPPAPGATTPPGSPLSTFVARPNIAIGPEGGSVVSEDGLLTLTVPPGAVSDLANFGVQVVSNAAPGGVGLAYRVTVKEWIGDPDRDVPLLRPLEISLELRPDQLQDLAPEDLLMAYQGAGGRWQVGAPQTQAASLGAAAQNAGVRLKAQVRRPGDYAAAARYKIYPRQQSVRAGARLALTVLKISPAAADAGSGYSLADITAAPATAWAVQGVPNGNAALGQLIDEGRPSARVYLAPKDPPRPNPVRVTAQVSEGGRAVAVAASVRVLQGEGWMEFASFVMASRTEPNGGRLSVDAYAENAFDVTGGGGFATDEGGSASFEASPRPGGFARARVTYELSQVTQCVCTPRSGQIRLEIEYSFQGSGEPRPVLAGPSSISAIISRGGAYELFPPGNGLALDGDYTYSFREVYPCGDRQARPDKNVSGRDTFVFQSWINASDEALQGKLEPIPLTGVQRMTGTGTLRIKGTLPRKELQFRDELGVTVPSWFLKFDTLGALGRLEPAAPEARLPRQSRPLTQRPPAPLNTPLDLSDLGIQPRVRLASCKPPELPLAQRPGRPAPGQ